MPCLCGHANATHDVGEHHACSLCNCTTYVEAALFPRAMPRGSCTHCNKPVELSPIKVERLTLGKPVYCDVCKVSAGVPFVPGCPHGWAAPSICSTCNPSEKPAAAFPSHACLNCLARLPVCVHSWVPVPPFDGVRWCGKCGALATPDNPHGPLLPCAYVQCVAHARIFESSSL